MSRCDDYCCNNGCSQGRNCPARVAKVGRRYHGPEPLRASRTYLKELARSMLLVIAFTFAAALVASLIL